MVAHASDADTLRVRLAEAEAALHALRIGEQKVRIRRDGREIEFKPANRRDLEDYVYSLKKQLGEATRTARGSFVPVF